MLKRKDSFDCITRFRLPVLRALKDRELSVGEINAILSKSRGMIFFHLKALTAAGLVLQKTERKTVGWTGGHRHVKEIARFSLSGDGIAALEYYSDMEARK